MTERSIEETPATETAADAVRRERFIREHGFEAWKRRERHHAALALSDAEKAAYLREHGLVAWERRLAGLIP